MSSTFQNFEPARTLDTDFEKTAAEFVSREQTGMFRDPFAKPDMIMKTAQVAEPTDIVDRGLQKLASLADGQALILAHMQFGELKANAKVANDVGDAELIKAAADDLAEFAQTHPDFK